MLLFRCVIVLVMANLCFAEEFPHLLRLPSVGARFNVPGNASAGLCMVSPGQMDKCSRVEVAGVQYTVAYRKKGLGKPIVTYIHTTDPKFVSPAGHRVGDLIQVAQAALCVHRGLKSTQTNQLTGGRRLWASMAKSYQGRISRRLNLIRSNTLGTRFAYALAVLRLVKPHLPKVLGR
jgi:hypothetical protein